MVRRWPGRSGGSRCEVQGPRGLLSSRRARQLRRGRASPAAWASRNGHSPHSDQECGIGPRRHTVHGDRISGSECAPPRDQPVHGRPPVVAAADVRRHAALGAILTRRAVKPWSPAPHTVGANRWTADRNPVIGQSERRRRVGHPRMRGRVGSAILGPRAGVGGPPGMAPVPFPWTSSSPGGRMPAARKHRGRAILQKRGVRYSTDAVPGRVWSSSGDSDTWRSGVSMRSGTERSRGDL